MNKTFFIGTCIYLLVGCSTQQNYGEPCCDGLPKQVMYVDKNVAECTRQVQQVRQVEECEKCSGFSVTAMNGGKRCGQ